MVKFVDILYAIIASVTGLIALFAAWMMMSVGAPIMFVGVYALATVFMVIMQIVSQCIVKRPEPTTPDGKRGPIPKAWGISNLVFTALFLAISLYVVYAVGLTSPVNWGFGPALIALIVVFAMEIVAVAKKPDAT